MTNQDNSSSLETTYKYVRDYIVHEDSLINFRLNWLLVIQGLLFTAYGLSIKEPLSSDINKFRLVISFLGIATCILIFLSISTGIIAIKNLEAFWRKQKNRQNPTKFAKFPFITGGADPKRYNEEDKLLQKLHKFQYRLNLAFLSPLCIPLIFFCAWIILMVKF